MKNFIGLTLFCAVFGLAPVTMAATLMDPTIKTSIPARVCSCTMSPSGAGCICEEGACKCRPSEAKEDDEDDSAKQDRKDKKDKNCKKSKHNRKNRANRKSPAKAKKPAAKARKPAPKARKPAPKARKPAAR